MAAFKVVLAFTFVIGEVENKEQAIAQAIKLLHQKQIKKSDAVTEVTEISS